MKTKTRVLTLESRFDRRPAAWRAQNGNGHSPALALEVQPPPSGDDWPAWLLGLARDYRLVEHSSIDGWLALTAAGWDHSNAAWLAEFLARLNALAREKRTLLILATREEIYEVVTWLDGGYLDLDSKQGTAGAVVGADLVIAPPYDRLAQADKRLASDVSLAMRAFCLLCGWPWPLDLAGARQTLMAMRDFAMIGA